MTANARPATSQPPTITLRRPSRSPSQPCTRYPSTPTQFEAMISSSAFDASMCLPDSSTVVPSTEKVWIPNQLSSHARLSTIVLRRCFPWKMRAMGADFCTSSPVARANAAASSCRPAARRRRIRCCATNCGLSRSVRQIAATTSAGTVARPNAMRQLPGPNAVVMRPTNAAASRAPSGHPVCTIA